MDNNNKVIGINCLARINENDTVTSQFELLTGAKEKTGDQNLSIAVWFNDIAYYNFTFKTNVNKMDFTNKILVCSFSDSVIRQSADGKTFEHGYILSGDISTEE